MFDYCITMGYNKIHSKVHWYSRPFDGDSWDGGTGL